MNKQVTVLTRKRRGPAPTGKGTLVGVRLQPDMLAGVDQFIAEHDEISRPEAIRLIIRDWMTKHQVLKGE
jgi:metal-responsive CopG/Arc/MetJ family transcriptional regulator